MTTTHPLAVPLTSDELIEKAERIAWVLAEIQEAVDILKAAKDNYREVSDGLTSRQQRLAERIRSRKSPQLKLDLQLAPEGVVDVADSLVLAMAELERETGILEEAKRHHKHLDRDLNHELLQLAAQIRKREEMRQVDVEWKPNHGAGTVELWRLDTGELVERRLMSNAEAAQDFDSVGLAVV